MATDRTSRLQHAEARPLAADPPVDPQVLYWQAKAVKRLRLAQWFEQKRNDWRRYAKGLRAAQKSPTGHDGGPRGTGASPAQTICSVFGAHCSEAIAVARCESGLNLYARNGDYLGLFQFGSFARAKYGFGWSAVVQSRAAYRYFLDAGWGPWACKP